MIVLGVSGSIACYKAVETLRLFLKAGHATQVVMTPSATRFVTPLTFRALSGRDVLIDLFEPAQWQMAHLDLLKSAKGIVIVPATADTLSKLAHGDASSALTTLCLSVGRTASGEPVIPIWIAPAMHDTMWLHPATQANVKTLQSYGYRLVGPVSGDLGKVGDHGIGRLVEPASIVETVLKSLPK